MCILTTVLCFCRMIISFEPSDKTSLVNVAEPLIECNVESLRVPATRTTPNAMFATKSRREAYLGWVGENRRLFIVQFDSTNSRLRSTNLCQRFERRQFVHAVVHNSKLQLPRPGQTHGRVIPQHVMLHLMPSQTFIDQAARCSDRFI
jgi:hypothetical protein